MFELIAVTVGLGFTHHIDHCRQCNEVHPAVVAYFDGPGPDWLTYHVSAYKNSPGVLGLTAGVRASGPLGTYLDLGFATGYESITGYPVVPFGRAGVEYQHASGLGGSAFVFPSTDGKGVRMGVGVEVTYTITFP